jgi:hypothetical protein
LYEAVVPVVVRHGGHANKFMGDGLLAVFGAPERHADHAARALAAACDVAQLVRAGVSGELGVGIGVNSGRVVVGTVGGGLRRDFTVIGDPVNTAARVEAATRLTGTTSLSPRLPCAPWVPLAMTSRSDDPCRLGAKPQRCACTPLGHTANLKCRAQNPPVITAGAQPLSKPGP